MLRQLSFVLTVLTAVRASGEFVVLNSPDSVEFTVNGEIEQSSLKEILSAALGYTVKQKDAEHSIAIWDPFSMPKALVAIPIDGIEFMPFIRDKTKIKCPVNVNEVEETTWQAIRSRIEERNTYNDNTLVRINLSDGVDALGQSALGELKLGNMEKLTALNSEIEEDRKFIEQIQLLRAIIDNVSSVKKHDSGTDVYWLVVSLKPVLELHGNTSETAKECFALLNDVMECINKAFVNAYDNRVITVAFTNDASKVRNTRSVLLERQLREANSPRDDEQEGQNNVKDEEDNIDNNMSSTSESNIVDGTTERTDVQERPSGTSENSDLGLINKDSKINTNTQTIGQPEFSGRSKTYTENYPVIFNIMLWFGIVFFFSLLAICIAIADMDPGRDSIIYRMTSNRMKKDN